MFGSPCSLNRRVSSASSTLMLSGLSGFLEAMGGTNAVLAGSPDRMNSVLSHEFAFGLSPCHLVPSSFLQVFCEKRERDSDIYLKRLLVSSIGRCRKYGDYP